MNRSLDPAQIASLLKQDDVQERAKRASRIKRKKLSTEPRTYDTWFHLPSHFGNCSNDDCIDPRPNLYGKAMVADINGSDICRYCFLAGVNQAIA